ncbi:MAG TPA: class I SAM-dependent methyltransferase [Candidatus Bilamarchaeum sp.]|nr:class I SAM-dependent methyltransferase [Candidatus Bilamarchaeum sp.]
MADSSSGRGSPKRKLHESVPPTPALLLPPPLVEKCARKESGVRPKTGSSPAPLDASVLREIELNIAQFDMQTKSHEASIRQLLSTMSSAQVNNLIYRLFAPHYDEHMKGHARAIDILLGQLVQVENIAFTNNRIIRGNVLEMSCGTGSVIKLLSSALPPARLEGMGFVANDLSEDMAAIARAKLAGLPVTFTSQDVKLLPFPAKMFGTAILSQTIHLITDEDVVRQEREENYMNVDEDRHLDQKYRAVANAWNSLEDGGTFLLIDEWPAMLSDRGGPLGPGFRYLFNDELRPISRDAFQGSIMETLPGSCFVAHLKVAIDSKHHMNVIAYRKQPKTGSSRIPPPPDYAAERRKAFEKVLEIFKRIDRDFIGSMEPTGGEPWIRLLPMHEGVKVVSDPKEEYLGDSANNCVVINQCLHGLEPYDRYDLISGAVSSLKLGGSLIIVDEWNPPEGKRPLRLNSLKPLYMNRFSKFLVFAGSVRVPISAAFDSGMYGFEYRKVF